MIFTHYIKKVNKFDVKNTGLFTHPIYGLNKIWTSKNDNQRKLDDTNYRTWEIRNMKYSMKEFLH